MSSSSSSSSSNAGGGSGSNSNSDSNGGNKGRWFGQNRQLRSFGYAEDNNNGRLHHPYGRDRLNMPMGPASSLTYGNASSSSSSPSSSIHNIPRIPDGRRVVSEPWAGKINGGDASGSSSLANVLPREWKLIDNDVQTNGLVARSTTNRWSVVVANSPIPTETMMLVAKRRRARSSASTLLESSTSLDSGSAFSNLLQKKSPARGHIVGGDTSMYPTMDTMTMMDTDENNRSSLQRSSTATSSSTQSQSSIDVFYFEATLGRGGSMIRIGLVSGGYNQNRLAGDAPNSIAMDSGGILYVSGRPVAKDGSSFPPSEPRPWTTPLQPGDTIGCGMEILGMRRIFWTRNGQLLAPPSQFGGLSLSELSTFPSLGLQDAEVVGNFGVRQPFVWPGSDRLVLIPHTERIPESSSPSLSNLSSSLSSSQSQLHKSGSMTSSYPDPSSIQDLPNHHYNTSGGNLSGSNNSTFPPMGSPYGSASGHSYHGQHQTIAARSESGAPPLYSVARSVQGGSVSLGSPSTSSSNAGGTLFGRKAKRGTLEDDVPTATPAPAAAAPSPGTGGTLFGRKARRGTLEDDVPNATPMPAPASSNAGGTLFGRKAKRGTLEDDHPNVEGVIIGGLPPPDSPTNKVSASMESQTSSSSNDGPNPYRPSSMHNPSPADLGNRLTPSASPLSVLRKSNHQNSTSSNQNLRNSSSGGSGSGSSSGNTSGGGGSGSSGGGGGGDGEKTSGGGSSGNKSGNHKNAAEDEMFKAAIQQSVKKKKGKNLVMLLTPQEIEESRSFARELRNCCGQSSADISLVKNLVELCKSMQNTVKKALEDAMKYDPSMVDLEELFTINDVLLDAISTAEKMIQKKEGKRSSSGGGGSGGGGSGGGVVVSSEMNMLGTPSTSNKKKHKSRGGDGLSSSTVGQPSWSKSGSTPGEPAPLNRRQTTKSLEIDSLVRKKDIFSLICMLRAQSEKRLDSALALMKFARMAERTGDMESMKLRNEIRSSGGMHSLLTVYRTKGTTRELRVVAALAVAYLLPPFVESSSLSSPSLALKIVECLRFLFMSRPVSPKSEEIPQIEMYNASILGLTTFWINAFFPMVQKEEARKGADSTSNKALLVRARGRQVRSMGNVRQESLEIQELLEMTVSLIVSMAKLSNVDIYGSSSTPIPDSKLNLRYTLVEQMCAVDVARPIAVREGVLRVLVGWMKSQDPEKVQPAATAVRDLTSTLDKYMAGWIHSQIVSEGALSEIVELSVSESVGNAVRLAVAQILSSLCVAPHTRAAVVEAQCINYLIPLLYDHTDPTSKQVAYAAGSALLQLAAGAMTRSSVYRSDSSSSNEAVSPDKRDKVINDIVHGGAIGPLVAMARSGQRGKLRYMSIETLQVISEDKNPARMTRLQLCEEGAAEALGKVLKDDVHDVCDFLRPGSSAMDLVSNTGSIVNKNNDSTTDIINELHQALCTLANILDPAETPTSSRSSQKYHHSRFEESEQLLIRGCVQTAQSGGLRSLLWISTLPLTAQSLTDTSEMVNSTDLMIEACRLLAALSPLLLSDLAASEGYTSWTCRVLHAMTAILRQVGGVEDDDQMGVARLLENDALRGLGALARSEPLKVLIVDSSLPYLLRAKSSIDSRNSVVKAANDVCLSLGFAEELAVQVAGNDPKLLGDWFCMQRSLLIQAMAREELRALLSQTWKEQLAEARRKGLLTTPRLTRETSGHSSASSHHSDDHLGENGLDDFFENLTRDEDTVDVRESVLTQYENVYQHAEEITRSDPKFPRSFDSVSGDESMLARHMYPLNDSKDERDWILSHKKLLNDARRDARSIRGINEHVQRLLDCCMPSRLLQGEVLPLCDLRPESSFNFRALMMPQRRYFSFRREAQLVARLCDKHPADSDDVHWTLGFTNSSFAGEFAESLVVQALYRCSMIRGLSFTRNSDWALVSSADKENESDDGNALLADLAGSLPPWVSYLTYDNVLNDRTLKSLVTILETMGTLSTQGNVGGFGRMNAAPGLSEPVGQKQGSFRFFAIRNSPYLTTEVWGAFFDLIGRSERPMSSPTLRPLSSLRILDISGNNLGDERSAYILGLVHEKQSGSSLEQLDLSRNSIRQGKNVVRVLRSYIELYRFNQSIGVKMSKRTWRSPLHTLNLSGNQLYTGSLPLEIVALLKNNALSLKTLDLSYNGLENEGYQFTEVLCGSILKNTCIRELNLSSNSFSPEFINSVLDTLLRSESESGLSFLRFDDNSPPLMPNQLEHLEAFQKRSRAVALERFINDKERIKNGETIDIPMIAERNPSLTIRNWGKHISSRTSLEEMTPEDDDVDDEGTMFARAESSMILNRGLPEKPTAKGDNMITVLFSAPLVFHDDQRTLRPFAKLDFDMERELLWQCLKEASRDIELSFDNATHHRLLAAMTKRCSCLHYSGHGHPTYLPLENGKGGPHWLEVNVLKDLIVQGGGAPFKFVFVSACHSGLAGETFASAGVPHVVCCQQESELKDTAALAFTRQFYLSLAVGHTVKESFDQGCKAVRATPNLRNAEAEMRKFILLPRDGNHDVPVFNARPLREWPKTGSSRSLRSTKSARNKGLMRSRSLYFGGSRSSELSVRNMMQEDPSPTPPQFFLGREVDMYHVLGAILTKRLVSIVGDTGCGRSSLVCALCHYINERSSTIMEVNRLYFVKTKQGRGGDRCRSLILSLLNKLVEDEKTRLPSQQANMMDIEDLSDLVCKALKPTKALIVFDRTELLEDSEETQHDFPMFLGTLFRETRNVRVVLTGKQPVGIPSLGGVVEQPYYLSGLNFANTVRLFANLCPHLHTPAERQQFFVRMITDGEQADLCNHNTDMMSSRTKRLFQILGNGMPAQTEKAAYNITHEQVAMMGADDDEED